MSSWKRHGLLYVHQANSGLYFPSDDRRCTWGFDLSSWRNHPPWPASNFGPTDNKDPTRHLLRYRGWLADIQVTCTRVLMRRLSTWVTWPTVSLIYSGRVTGSIPFHCHWMLKYCGLAGLSSFQPSRQTLKGTLLSAITLYEKVMLFIVLLALFYPIKINFRVVLRVHYLI